ncbi:hypothetical protein [Aureibacter tunicatorum]|uniref:Uncharacterized protein n=1 Tax=Aureibacter tunicatorum TaxID=866807 RepID=A0AAE4BT08_9BACT|nr:hypothetical protein [Aureibacter tunicatorum]MDR6239368.1 hypothetical protein [Aureibacter tunicatorum]BDD04709.1 hypothetical protein AUTU_21920 [Aureibacter tunicatorum]
MRRLIVLFFALLVYGFTYGQYNSFELGRYYTVDGDVRNGLISYGHDSYEYADIASSDRALLFMNDESEVIEEVSADLLTGFVMGQDSFAVVNYYRGVESNTVNKDFAKVIMEGKITLLEYSERQLMRNSYGESFSTVNYYLLEKDGKCIPVTRRFLKEGFCEIIGDEFSLKQKFSNPKSNDWKVAIAMYNREGE